MEEKEDINESLRKFFSTETKWKGKKLELGSAFKDFPFNLHFEKVPKFREARKKMVKEYQKLRQFNELLGAKYILLRDLFVTLLQPAEETMSILSLIHGIYQDSKEEMEQANEHKTD